MKKLIAVIEEDGEISTEEIRHKRPQTYMLTDWTFDRLLNYIKDELWANPENVKAIELDYGDGTCRTLSR